LISTEKPLLDPMVYGYFSGAMQEANQEHNTPDLVLLNACRAQVWIRNYCDDIEQEQG